MPNEAPRRPIENAGLAKALGSLLRTRREDLGWSRGTLVEKIADMFPRTDELHGQTIATYELGIRRITLDRFVVICTALDLDSVETLARGLRLADFFSSDSSIAISLAALAASTDKKLRPLSQWATVQLISSPETQMVELTVEMIESFAKICAVDIEKLRSLLDAAMKSYAKRQ
ncbi:helix-turn-helix transcriptional regulator [Actinokineospora auranticolor]|uniref:Helix-turn-helix protein n=1 Tax=Actinokineospora auranticolor TaxID=155976 RepID=A0A2S6GKT6_9PSEU|nr:helix-turn-helix transcriptional regulator [Actinokineospora auranticolor]PPK65847.1 hypothetical protein CLV40_112109 [Actinokineospora auranticolor]